MLEVAGLLLLSSIIIAYAQQYYNRLYELSTSVRKRKETTVRHLGIMLAFRVLQENC